jgi:hypothetical protein
MPGKKQEKLLCANGTCNLESTISAIAGYLDRAWLGFDGSRGSWINALDLSRIGHEEQGVRVILSVALDDPEI